MPGGWAGGFATGSPAVDYKFVDVKNDRKEFEKVITQHGKEGWEFCSSERFGQGELVLVFKKSKGVVGGGGFGGTRRNDGPGGMGMPGMGGVDRVAAADSAVGRDSAEGRIGIRSASFQLKNASAADVVTALQKAFPKVNLRVVAENASNSVLVVSADPAVMKDIHKMIEQLDAKPGSGPKPPPGAGSGPSGPPPGPGGFGSGPGPGPGGPMGGPGAGAAKPAVTIVNRAEEMAVVLKKLYPNAEVIADADQYGPTKASTSEENGSAGPMNVDTSGC